MRVRRDPIRTTKYKDGDVRRLSWLRGRLIHFKSRIWSIEIEGLPRIVVSAVEIIEQLLDHPAFSFRLKRVAAARAGKAKGELRQILSTAE